MWIYFYLMCLCAAFAAPPEWGDKPLLTGNIPEGYTGDIYKLKVSDPDGDPITFTSSWAPTTGTDYFYFDETTQLIGVASGARLDMDVMTDLTFVLTITASDGTAETTVPTTITLNIVKSPPPDIEPATLSFTVDEGLAGQELVSKGGVSGYTTEQFSDIVTYNIVSATSNLDYFAIDSSTGQITFAKDYYIDGANPLPSTVTIKVQGTDTFDEVDTVDITFTIQDVNQIPQFAKLPTSTSVAEDLTPGLPIFTVATTDLDSLDVVTLSATYGTGADIFDFDPNTGVVSLKVGQNLDYETTKTYTITITADDTKDTNNAILTITVTNVNEAPSFDNTIYYVTENEGVAGSTLSNTGFVSSTSDPEGDKLTFKIIGGANKDKFNMASTTGIFTYASDYEIDPSSALPSTVVLDIEATDPSGLKATAQLSITITNVNKLPTLDNLPDTISIPDDTTGGASVFTVTFSDLDTADTVTVTGTHQTSGGSSKFTINSQTGEVTVKNSATFDVSVQNQYTIRFTANDGQGNSANKVLVIDITQTNKPPTFSFTTFSVTVNEGLQDYALPDPGIKATATDPDNDAMTFSILSGTNSDKFKIDANTGIVSYAQDYEVDPNSLPGSVVLNIQVSDPLGQTDSTTLTLTINDVNKAPALDNLGATTTVAEDIASGTSIFTVQFSDPDSLDSPTLEYEFVDSSNAALFDVNKITGLVSLKVGASLDYETRTTHRIRFVATDSKLNSTSSSLRIDVTNVNEAPTFSSQVYTATVPEGPAGGVFPDAGVKSGSSDPESDTLAFTLVSGNTDNRFAIDANSGILSFAKDYEVDALQLPGYAQVTVQAADPSGLTATATVDITITNVNKPPTLDNLPTAVSVDESLLGGSYITTVTGADPDSGDTVTFQHTFTTSSASSVFNVDDNTGTVTLKPTATLDYESENVYQISFTATDGEATSSPQILTININNINEAPTFSGKTFQATVDEGPSGTVVPDDGIKSSSSDPEGDALTYSIVSGANRDKFNMDPNTGIVTFAQDYEVDAANNDQPGSVFLVVQVEDPSGLKDTTSLDITINNVNKSPTIDNLPTTVTVPENTLGGSTIFTVQTSDPDTGDIITLQYTFNPTDGSAIFNTDVNNGVVLLNPTAKFDYETKRLYAISVAATDSALTAAAQYLRIQITDVNEAPSFSSPTYDVTVSEGQTGNIIVPYLTSSVTDPDSTDTKTFSILPSSNSANFNIDTSTGRITYAVDYDADPKRLPDRVTLNVQVEDKGGLTDTCIVDVTINNINQAPTITNAPATVNIAEDTLGGSLIYDVTATDVDSADVTTVYHRFLDSRSSSMFDIDSTGRVTLKPDKALDYETDSYYRIQFEASDSQLNSTSAILEIFITNVNEAPSFSTSFTTTVNEGPAGTALPFSGISTYSSDPERDTLTYDIVGGVNQDMFMMDPTSAAISFAKDYEVDATQQPGFVQLTVRATDPDGLSTTALLNVTVLNVNKPPSITNLDADINVPENLRAGTTVFTVLVSDPDSTDVTTLLPRYTVGSANNVFDIDATSGALSIKSPNQLNFDTTQLYRIEFLVTDSKLTSTLPVTLTVHITNTNYAPVFTSTSFPLTVPEGQAGDAVLNNLTCCVTDSDAGDVQSFSILAGTYSEYFNINPDTGNITYAKNYNADPSLLPYNVRLVIQATDMFNLTGTTTVDLTITDVNQPPVIVNLPKTVTMAANVDSGTKIFTVETTDPDSGDVSTVGYQHQLRSSQNKFDIDSSTGVVTIKDGATFEYGSNPIQIEFTATDGTAFSEMYLLTIEITPAVSEPAFLSKPENLGWFVPLMILLGLALLGLLGFLLYKFCCNGGYGGRRSKIFDSENQKRLVRKQTPPSPEVPPHTKFEPTMKVKISKLQFPRIYKWIPE